MAQSLEESCPDPVLTIPQSQSSCIIPSKSFVPPSISAILPLPLSEVPLAEAVFIPIPVITIPQTVDQLYLINSIPQNPSSPALIISHSHYCPLKSHTASAASLLIPHPGPDNPSNSVTQTNPINSIPYHPSSPRSQPSCSQFLTPAPPPHPLHPTVHLSSFPLAAVGGPSGRAYNSVTNSISVEFT